MQLSMTNIIVVDPPPPRARCSRPDRVWHAMGPSCERVLLGPRTVAVVSSLAAEVSSPRGPEAVIVGDGLEEQRRLELLVRHVVHDRKPGPMSLSLS